MEDKKKSKTSVFTWWTERKDSTASRAKSVKTSWGISSRSYVLSKLWLSYRGTWSEDSQFVSSRELNCTMNMPAQFVHLGWLVCFVQKSFCQSKPFVSSILNIIHLLLYCIFIFYYSLVADAVVKKVWLYSTVNHLRFIAQRHLLVFSLRDLFLKMHRQ